jgi:small subunit ribosomal protein S9
MIDDERPDAPQEGDAPQDAPEDAAPSPSADPSEAPTAGDESLTGVEDEAEQVTDAPDAPSAEGGASEGETPAEPDVDAPNESAPGHVDPETVKDAEPSGEPAEADAPNESAPGHAEPAAEGEPAAAEPAEGAPAEERPRRDKRQPGRDEPKEDVVPGAHLEPDLVLDEARQEADADEYADRYASDDGEPQATDAEQPAGEAPSDRQEPRTALDLAADARYQATGKRKTSVARVILKPGDGAYTINGRSLEDYFPRAALQRAARQPLQTAGFEKRMDVVAKLHGGGISAQAGALRHGVARALVEADPALRVELKRRGFLSRDDRAKERKKAGLKKARKRPQFSKR